jgi:hypothetical protein
MFLVLNSIMIILKYAKFGIMTITRIPNFKSK